MAARRGKKKQSSREDFMLKEQLVIEESVFDMRTMLRIRKLFTHKILERMLFLIGKGKEADTYVAQGGEGVGNELIAMKIFRIETSSFEHRKDYIIGDPRFSRIKTNTYSIVNEWCKKEYGNLKIAHAAGVRCPKPFIFSGNVLAMELIESDGGPSPMLKNVRVQNPEKVLDMILEDIKKMYESDLVHADISEYNVLMKEDVPYLIDFGQAVVIRHPNAHDFLVRDIGIILGYFARIYKVKKNKEDVLRYITGKENM